MTWRWPVTLRTQLPGGARLTLRPLRRADRGAWESVRQRNDGWLGPWESTVPGEVRGQVPFGRLRRGFDQAGRQATMLPLAIDVDDRLVGQVQLFDVLWGARATASAGYWLDEAATGHGYASWSLALALDHALLTSGLHRVEVAVRPENTASLAVVQRLRLPEEGVRRGAFHVDGAWRDHRCFAVVAEDLSPSGYAAGGLVRLLRSAPATGSA
ncbi:MULTISPECIES: GNAT family N-acetyltransferase [unclassified Ornithinimicrobium]|uniref:GNAT family N-acetyltransferase n=1 Tax=unclassified Ornithinimicrobium TaxID=2615080 RepID=UPI003851C8F6